MKRITTTIALILTAVPFIIYCDWEPVDVPSTASLGNFFSIDNDVYGVATFTYEAFKTTNNGISWNKDFEINKDFELYDGYLGVADIIKYDDVLILGMPIEGVFMSNDSGNSWYKMNNGLIPNSVVEGKERFYPNRFIVNNNELYCISRGLNKLNKTKDKWENIEILHDMTPDCIAFKGDTIFCGTWDDIYSDNGYEDLMMSTDNGESWEEISGDIISVEEVVIKNDSIYIISQQGFFKSKIGEFDWKKSFSWNFDYRSSLFKLGNYLVTDYNITGIHISKDNGETWIKIDNDIPVNSGVLFVHNDVMYYSTVRGMYISDDFGSTWKLIEDGLEGNRPISGFVDKDDGNLLLSIEGQGLFELDKKSGIWTNLLSEINIFDVDGMYLTDNILFVKKSYPNYNQGYIFSDVNDLTKYYEKTFKKSYFASLYTYFKGKLLALSTSPYPNYLSGIYTYDLTSNGWDAVEDEWKLTDSSIISGIKVRNDTLFATTHDKGIIYSLDAELWYYDLEDQFNYIDENTGQHFISKLSSFEISDSYMLVNVENKGLYISTNGGREWELQNDELKEKKIYDYYIHDNEVIIATDFGVYYSSNRGKDFKQFNEGLLRKIVTELIVDDNYIYAATYSGLFVRPLNEIISSVEEPQERIYDYFYAAPPQPNPANNQTGVRVYWSLEHEFDLSLTKIYDYTGSEVSSVDMLSLERTGKNHAIVTWNCSQIDAGMYIIVFKFGSRTVPVKVIVK